jgi:hypothetical protein
VRVAVYPEAVRLSVCRHCWSTTFSCCSGLYSPPPWSVGSPPSLLGKLGSSSFAFPILCYTYLFHSSPHLHSTHRRIYRSIDNKQSAQNPVWY